MSASPVSIAQGQAAYLSYILETTRGTTPASPTMKELRSTSRKIDPMKNTFASEEIRRDRQVGYLRHGSKRVEGSPGGELSSQSYDDWLASLFGGAWAAVTTSGSPNIAASNSTSQFTRAAGSFIADGYRAGDIIITTGFSNSPNNGLFLVTAVSSGSITVDGTLTTESTASGRTLTLQGKRLDAGPAALDTYTIERGYSDIAQYDVNKGVSINSADVTIQPEKILGIAFGLLGMNPMGRSGSSLGTPTAAASTQPMSAFEGVMYEGGAKIAIVTGVSFHFENGNSLSPVVGSAISPDVNQGTFKATGSISAFLTGSGLLNKFLNETLTSIYMRCNDPDGNFLNFVSNAAKYTGDTNDPPAQGPVVETLPFQSLVPTTGGPSFSIQRSNS